MWYSAVGFVVTLMLSLLVAPLAAEAQPAKKVPRIGYLSPGDQSEHEPAVDAFRQGLSDLGYTEGQNILIEYRFAAWQEERLAEFAAELVRLPVDVLVTRATPAARAARHATNTIPIIFTNVNDPVGQGLVASLAQPGGNVTGVSTLSSEISGKRLELLKEAVPGIRRVAVFWNTANRGIAIVFRETQDAAQALGLQLQSLEVQGPDDFDRAFAAALEGRVDGVVMLPATPVRSPTQVVDFAAAHRLPAMYAQKAMVEAGGLMSYGPNYDDIARRTAVYVAKILKGAKPVDLPVEQPTTFELVINLKTARVLGLTMPPSLLLLATEVLQ